MNYKFVDIKPPQKLTRSEKEPVSIIEPDMSMLVVGRQGSGKTYLIDQMIKNKDLLCQKYDAIYFIGPSPMPLVDDHNRASIHTAFPDVDWIKEKCELWNQKKLGRKAIILFIMDDCLAQLEKFCNDEEAKMLFWNRRWSYQNLTISYLFTAQYARAFPRRFRSCLNTIIAFSMSEEDWKIIAKDCMYKRTKEQEAVIACHFSKPHNFITIRCDTGHVFLNFNTLI